MATVTSICNGLATQLLTLSYVDSTSIKNFLPAVTTANVAVIIPPQGQRDTGEPQVFGLSSSVGLEVIHRLRCEFWVKHVPDSDGTAGTTMQRAREIPLDAMQVLLANDGTNYDLAPEEAIESETADTFIQVGDQPYIVVTLTVPCWNQIGSG